MTLYEQMNARPDGVAVSRTPHSRLISRYSTNFVSANELKHYPQEAQQWTQKNSRNKSEKQSSGRSTQKSMTA